MARSGGSGTGGVAVTVTVPTPGLTTTPVVPPAPRTPAPSVGVSTPPPTRPHGGLAFTGLPATQLLLLAVIVVALGTLLVRATRPSGG